MARRKTNDLIAVGAVAAVPAGWLFWFLGLPTTGTLVVAVTSCLVGLAVFLNDGNRFITPVGAYLLATALFLGLAAVLLLRHPHFEVTRYVMAALSMSHVATVISWRVAGRLSSVTPYPAPPASVSDGKSHITVSAIAAGLFGFAFLFAALPATRHIIVAAAYLAVVLMTLGFSVIPRKVSLLGGAALLGAVAFGYYFTFFTGEGRLRLATLGLSCVIAFNLVRPSIWHKRIVVAMLIPFLIWGGLTRASDSHDSRADTAVIGAYSFYSPLLMFGEFLERESDPMQVALPRMHGHTFLSAALVWVPREVWPDKPVGFGRIIAAELLPHIVAEHSEAALAYGEWWANFGLAGIALAAAAGGLLLVHLQRAHRRLAAKVGRRQTTADLLTLAGLAIFIGGLADYMWVGTHTFMSRGGISLLVLAPILLLARRRYRRAARRDLSLTRFRR